MSRADARVFYVSQELNNNTSAPIDSSGDRNNLLFYRINVPPASAALIRYCPQRPLRRTIDPHHALDALDSHNGFENVLSRGTTDQGRATARSRLEEVCWRLGAQEPRIRASTSQSWIQADLRSTEKQRAADDGRTVRA